MARLSEMQKKEIVAEYASGEYSKAGLARKYKVSYNTIQKTIAGDKGFREKVTNIKNEAEKTVAEKIRERLEQKADGLLDISDLAIKRLKETIGHADTRDAAGALKISMEALLAILDRVKDNNGKGQSDALSEFVRALNAASAAHSDHDD